MPLTESTLVSGLKSLPPVSASVQAFITALEAQYITYANACTTGKPLASAETGILVPFVPGGPISLQFNMPPFTDPAPDATPAQFAEALATGISLFWMSAAFGVPAAITGAVTKPPTELNVIMPGETSPSMKKLQLVLETAYLNKQPDDFATSMENLAKILHACTKTGVTSGVDSTIPLVPIPFISILGAVADTEPLDLSEG